MTRMGSARVVAARNGACSLLSLKLTGASCGSSQGAPSQAAALQGCTQVSKLLIGTRAIVCSLLIAHSVRLVTLTEMLSQEGTARAAAAGRAADGGREVRAEAGAAAAGAGLHPPAAAAPVKGGL